MYKPLGADYPFNSKSDNFLDLDKIHNIVISSLQDEEIPGLPQTVGTLQLYNRKYSDVSQDDLARISYMRKLIGSTLIKCEYYTVTLQTVIGMNLNDQQMENSKVNVDNVIINRQEGSTGPLVLVVSTL